MSVFRPSREARDLIAALLNVAFIIFASVVFAWTSITERWNYALPIGVFMLLDEIRQSNRRTINAIRESNRLHFIGARKWSA